MPGDVPLARPPRRLEFESWADRWPLWDIYFAVIALATVTLVLSDRPESVPAKAGAVGLLAGLVGWYVGFGRALMRHEDEDWRGYAYLAGVLVLFVPAVALVDSSAVVLFAVWPQTYMVMPALPATGAVVAFAAAQSTLFLIRTGDLNQTVGVQLPIAATTVALAAIVGTSTRRVARQNAERAALIRQLDSSRAEVAQLSHEAGVTAERQRLAGDIHDTIAQDLSSVLMLIQAADAELDRDPAQTRQHLALAAQTARDNLAEARALVAALTPAALTGSSLPEALARLVDRFHRDGGTVGTWSVAGSPRPLPTTAEVVLLRAAQESLANARKHARAETVAVSLRYGADSVVLEVTDDGCGFIPCSDSSGYGLASMRARVEQTAGTLQVESVPGRGTTIRVQVPS
ncbi:sensor histidine kinase [Micromonosporaceae bacterium B7E4]